MVQFHAIAGYDAQAARRLYSEPNHLQIFATAWVYLTRKLHQVRQLCAGIINDKIIGPYFVEGNLTGGTYLNMLQNVIPDLMEDLPVAYLNNVYYQHDGCPAHYERNVRNHLNSVFGDHWIGRGGPVAWPARSPDLTLLDFYLWSEVKRIGVQKRATNS